MTQSNLKLNDFMKSFLDLPKFFSYIKKMNRGELYRLLPVIVKNYDSGWQLTLDNNTYNDVRRFVSLLKIYNVKHNIPKIDKYERNRKFIAHMFASIVKTGTLPSKVEATVEKADNLLEKMHAILDTSSEDIKSMFSNLNTFTGMFLPSGSCWIEIVTYITKFAAFGYLLSQEHNRNIGNILALLTLILPAGVGDCIISSLNRAIQGIWVKFMKKDELVAQDYADDSTIVSFFKVTVHLVKAMFAQIPVDRFKDMQLSVAKIKMVADYLKNSSTIFEYIMKLFQKTLEIIGNKLLKYYGKLPKILQQENLNELIDKYVKIKEERLDVRAVNNSYIARQVVEVYNEALQAQAKIVKSSKRMDFGQTKLLAYLNIMIRNLEQVVAKIPDHVKGTKNARRTKPFWIYLFGEPRIGKTAMFQPYIVNAIARCCGLIDKYRDYSEYTYFRNCGDEYWEKYCGQPVLWYNDLFQVFTNEQKVNIGIEELTNVVDDNLYPLNMAFEEKHNVYFDSQLVISNAQDDIVGKCFIMNKCLSEGTHIYSRRNLSIRLRVDKRYKNSSGLNYEAIQAAREAKLPFVGDLFPRDMYLVDFMDPNNGMYLRTVEFTEAIKIIVNSYKVYKNQQDHFKEKLFKHFEDMWAQAGDTWEDALHQAAAHEWNCSFCEQLYNETSMLNEDERDEIRTGLLLHCPHKVIIEKRRWVEFGEMIKVNVTAMWQCVYNFIKTNIIYISLSAVLALSPLVFMVVQNYFKDKCGNQFVASSAETTIKKAKQVVRLQTQEYSQQNKDVENKVMRNVAMVYIILNYEGVSKRMVLGSTLGVGGDIFMMPRHFHNRMVDFATAYGERNIKVELVFCGNQKYEMFFEDLVDLQVNFEHLVDIIFLQFPKLCCLSKMDKFFVTTRDEPVMYDSYLFGRRVDNSSIYQTIPVTNAILTSREYTHPELELPLIGKFLPAKKIVLPEGYEFRTVGVCVGDCGMLLMNVDDKLNARKIAGVHVAGSIKGNVGLASAIYQEDIQMAYEKAGIFITMECMDLQSIDKSTSVLKDGLVDMFNVCGVLYKDNKKVKLSIPMKTNISKSIFFDIMEQDFGPNKCLPAKLRPFLQDQAKISPMLLGLSKMCKKTVAVPNCIIDVIKDHMYVSIMSWHSDYVASPRILTLEEAINGLSDLNKIDITTSAGFPYQLNTVTGGKRDWFIYQGEKLIPNEELVQMISEREELAAQGIIKETYFVDTLKDELRPIEKVIKGKTRVFQVGPMCLSILMRKYFGSFIMHCQTTYLHGEMGIGINPNSYDWTLLLRRMKRIGNKFVNGDYSDYDASMSQPIMMSLIEIVDRFYGVSFNSRDSLIRQTLMATFLNNVHIVEDVVFMRLQGNMSGIALTTIVNCLFNMFLCRYAYYQLVCTDFTDFGRYLSCTFYGDDNLIAVNDAIIDKFNMLTYCEVMRSIGITYTTPDKTAMVCAHYTMDQISYLKRSFVFRSNIYYACLDWDTVMEIPRWSESDPNNILDQVNRFNCVLYESVNYGYDSYKKLYEKFFEYLLLARQRGFNVSVNQLLSYAYILRSMFPQFFTSDLTRQLDQTNSMLSKSGSFKAVNIGSDYSPDGSGVNSYLTTMNDNNNIIEAQSAEGAVQRAHIQVTRNMVTNDASLRDLMDNIVYSLDFSKNFDLIAMSVNSIQAMDQNAGESVRRAQITTTFDDTIPHQVKDYDAPTPTDLNAFPEVDLPAFINREWYIGETTWTSDAARTELIHFYNFPDKLNVYIRGKLENIAFWAPDFKLIFKINGTPMHYGRFMFCLVPSADILHPTYLKPQNMSHYKFVQLSPTGNQSVVMDVPWLHFFDRVSISAEQSTIPWVLYGFPMCPLQSANATKVAPVTISVYAQIVNPRFSGYINKNKLVAQSAEQEVLSERENVTSRVTQTGIIPMVNSIARKVEKIAGDMSQLAVDVGYSNAPNLTATKPVIFRNLMLNKAEDLPNTIVLGPSQNASVEVNPNFANACKDGMMISKIGGRMILNHVIKITSGTDVNNNILDFALSPYNLFFVDYAMVDVLNTCYPHPAAYLARLHRFWRGSFKLHFSFVASAFHSMRVRFSYTPHGFEPNAMYPPNAGTSAHNVNEVWDINNQTDYSVRIPFHTIGEFLNKDSILGRIYITQLTKLTSSLDTPNPIFLQVWIGMDDDFQLAYPYISPATEKYLGETKLGNPDIGVWSTSLALKSAVIDDKYIEEEFLDDLVAHSADMLSAGNPMLNYRAMQFPSMSSEGLENLVYPTIGGVENKHKACRYCTSYEIASAKELTNMLTPIERQIVKTKTATTSATYVNAGRKIIPFGWMDRGANDTIWYNFLYQIMAIFRYARGSVRFAAISDRAVAATANMGDITSTWDGNFFQDYTTDVFFDSGSLGEITSGSHLFLNLAAQPVDVTIPFNSNARCVPQTYNVKTGGAYPVISYAPNTNDASLLMRIPVPANTAVDVEIAKIVWLVAGGDDLQLGYQIAVPRCRYGPTT